MSYDQQQFGVFAPNVLGMWGTDVVWSDANGDLQTIKAVFRSDSGVVVDDLSNVTYDEYVLRIPPGGLGTLEAEQVVTIKGRTYYVANVAPEKFGWHVATLQDHSWAFPGEHHDNQS